MSPLSGNIDLIVGGWGPRGMGLDMTEPAASLPALAANAADALPAGGLAKQLAKAEEDGRPLRIKLGVDPTSSDIHLGHCVVLGKLREFQDAGHTAVLIIGDYTARVGDPSQRSKSRPMITGEEIDANAKTYVEQAARILDMDRTEVRFNGEWLGAMSMDDLFALVSRSTVARLLERDDFAKRYKANESITMLEMLYPLLQGYDSVAIDADVELGGTDQLYNVLMGRDLMPSYGKPAQTVLTMPILVGTDGTDKMSKSLGNYIGVLDAPEEMFGKTMSIPDAAMPEWFRLASGLPHAEREDVVARLASGELPPNEAKRLLGRSIAVRFHGDGSGTAAEAHFDTLFRAKEVPDDIPSISATQLPVNEDGRIFLPGMLVEHMGLASGNEARRMITQGSVKIDGEVLDASTLEMDPAQLTGVVLQVGKRRFLRIEAGA
ncbi:MAG: tyrosyl-tRNA synthetase [Thermoleophilia bacterium]|nr:tyrosyl-tRNA synthetase [Thermoleophilia bacterium]